MKALTRPSNIVTGSTLILNVLDDMTDPMLLVEVEVFRILLCNFLLRKKNVLSTLEKIKLFVRSSQCTSAGILECKPSNVESSLQ
jgi:hypothetical protein